MSVEAVSGTRLRLQPLTYVDEGDEVMVGRPDTGSYGLFPRDGAEVLRYLAAGATLEQAASRWRERTGETLDVADFLETITDLEFVVADGEEPVAPTRVRWQRLGRVLFGPPAMAVYAAIVLGGIGAMVLDPAVRPSYRSLFFTTRLAAIPIVLALVQFPLLLVHEAFHALAARRLGLPSRLGIGRRFYYLVAETRLDALYSVPRARRYLPFLAGALIDAVGAGAFTLGAVALRRVGAPGWLSGLALALAFTNLLRIAWECLFYLETDFYFVLNTASGCADLHGAARSRVRAALARLLRRRPAAPVAGEWSDRDLAAARWYAPLMIVGYGVSLASLLFVGLPVAVRFWSTVVARLDGSQPRSLATLIDTVFFLLITLTELSLLGYVTVRDLRRRRARRGSSAAIEGTTP